MNLASIQMSSALFNSNPMIFNSNPMICNSNPMLDNSNPMIASGPMPGISEIPMTDWMRKPPVRADRFASAAEALARFGMAN